MSEKLGSEEGDGWIILVMAIILALGTWSLSNASPSGADSVEPGYTCGSGGECP